MFLMLHQFCFVVHVADAVAVAPVGLCHLLIFLLLYFKFVITFYGHPLQHHSKVCVSDFVLCFVLLFL